MADSPGELDYWLGDELPSTPPDGKAAGELDYWLGDELPPIYSKEAASQKRNLPLLGAG